MVILTNFSTSVTDGWTDGRTGGQTDGRTDGWMDRASHRDAWMHLKINKMVDLCSTVKYFEGLYLCHTLLAVPIDVMWEKDKFFGTTDTRFLINFRDGRYFEDGSFSSILLSRFIDFIVVPDQF